VDRFPIGDPADARRLSGEQTATIKELLTARGVADSHVATGGAGFDEPADPAAEARSSDQRVVMILLVPPN
jgi:outer membrane protein OmpA-like peptidoglycan-associated protein